MSKFACLFLIWAIVDGVFGSEEKQNGFVKPLDFGSFFDSDDSGVTSLASSPIAAAMLTLDKSQYPQLFDTIVSSSIDHLHSRVAPKKNIFAAESFGFNPIASQSFYPPAKNAKLIAAPNHQQQQNNQKPVRLQASPLYDIRTVHDPNYKIYKSEDDEQGEEILAALKKDPSVAAYFKPTVTNLEVSHPLKYRREELVEIPVNEQNYKPNAYIPGAARIRRYTGGRKHENLRKSSEEEDEDDSYGFKYISKPKAFDGPLYSAYTEERDPKKDYEYPYGYDSGYDHKEYERIKSLSEKQAAEIKQNPGNCKEVKKDSMTCMVCKDPKTGGNYESCSYVTEPKNNKYAYSKERKFDSNDEPDEPENEKKVEESKPSKYEEPKDETNSKYDKLTGSEPEKPYANYKQDSKEDDSGEKYKSYYVHTSKPTPSEALRLAENNKDSSEEKTDSLSKPYNYKQALPGFYTDNENKKDVENVLAEFKKKDRSSCKKVQKNGMTCFQCVDKTGLKHEECMFVSESAPKSSHLAYQELKEFTSKPATLEGNSAAAESQTVTTSAPFVQKSAAYVAAPNGYGKKLKRKKAKQATAPVEVSSLKAAASVPVASAVPAIASSTLQTPKTTSTLQTPKTASTLQTPKTASTLQTPKTASTVQTAVKAKRSVEAEAETNAQIIDESNIAPPEEFAGDSSKGAFWAETMPRYSAALGVTLPEYMLSRSEHEVAFDEVVANA